MPGIGIVSQVEFTDGDRFIRDLAPKLVGILLASDQPVEVGELWMTFEPVPSLDCWEVEFRHWEGREFPVTPGPDAIDSAPTARLVILLDYRSCRRRSGREAGRDSACLRRAGGDECGDHELRTGSVCGM